MLNLFRSYELAIENTYIITVKGNQRSEEQSARAQESCRRLGMPHKVWEAYNGLESSKIIPPKHLENDSVMNMLKITDHYLTRGEVACALSHISLWVHCAVIDKPIIILEHDAVMIEAVHEHSGYNNIMYLGGTEWVFNKWPILSIPPHATEGHNKHFICRAHAYGIDPAVAKNMISHVIKQGICDPLDIMIRADLFNITHCGVKATDLPEGTTIPDRPNEGRTTKRNDRLEW